MEWMVKWKYVEGWAVGGTEVLLSFLGARSDEPIVQEEYL
jgi:hypothetical protein